MSKKSNSHSPYDSSIVSGSTIYSLKSPSLPITETESSKSNSNISLVSNNNSPVKSSMLSSKKSPIKSSVKSHKEDSLSKFKKSPIKSSVKSHKEDSLRISKRSSVKSNKEDSLSNFKKSSVKSNKEDSLRSSKSSSVNSSLKVNITSSKRDSLRSSVKVPKEVSKKKSLKSSSKSSSVKVIYVNYNKRHSNDKDLNEIKKIIPETIFNKSRFSSVIELLRNNYDKDLKTLNDIRKFLYKRGNTDNYEFFIKIKSKKGDYIYYNINYLDSITEELLSKAVLVDVDDNEIRFNDLSLKSIFYLDKGDFI